MKYTKEATDQLVTLYKTGTTVAAIAGQFDVPERSIIAKLSSLGVYQKKSYLNKRGEPPVKKESYLEQIAGLLDCSIEVLESLEKCNKSVLKMIVAALESKKSATPEKSVQISSTISN